MPFILGNTNKWPIIIPDATDSQYGVMTPMQAQRLAADILAGLLSAYKGDGSMARDLTSTASMP